MATIFTKIFNGDIPCYKIESSDEFLAFLDINPLVKGHTLVIPKIEEDYIFDMESEALGRLMQFAQGVAIQIKKATQCKRVAVVVLGLDVPHAHIHLIPMNSMKDVDFGKTKLKLTDEEFREIQAQIISSK